MLVNNAISAGVGLIPIAGDVVLAVRLLFSLPYSRRFCLTSLSYLLPWLITSNLDVLFFEQAFKANSRNAALLEEYLRIRGDEFLKTSARRQEDPEVVHPGAGIAPGEVVSGNQKSSSLWGKGNGKGKSTAQATA